MQYSKHPLLYFPFDRLLCSSSTINLHMFISFALAMSSYEIYHHDIHRKKRGEDFSIHANKMKNYEPKGHRIK
jgi:hypothetical protein